MSMEPDRALERAKRSLEGLSLGDAFGELFFYYYPKFTRSSPLPSGPWTWTDDTHMALSIVETLKNHGQIEQDSLAQAFAKRFQQEPFRGYARGATRLLQQIASGADWRKEAPALFSGGSYGNGAAMRVAPIGGYFQSDPGRAAHEAQLSAVITHAHPEGQAGAIAVAVAAAIAADKSTSPGHDFLKSILDFVPDSEVREGIERALEIPPDQMDIAIQELGTGFRVSAQDTVPFCLWIAAYNLNNYEEALWRTVEGMGDTDTTCAIVGGIVALSAEEIPTDWLERREPLVGL